MYYIRMKERKNEKEGKMRISILISLYTVHFAFLRCTQNMKTLAPVGAEKCVTERTCNGFVLQMAHFYSKKSIVKKSLQNITK